MPVSTAGEFLTVHEAAKLLKVSPVTIKRWLKQGRLRAYHVGPRAVRIKQEDIEALLTPTPIATRMTVGPDQQRVHKEVQTSMPQTHEYNHIHRPQVPQAAELARRRQLVAIIRARREARVIAPLTAAQLIQIAREEDGEREREREHAAE
ncbi:MAG: hypothetical protein PVSMB4_05710 [Ktedonobacterales bacterium]